MLHRITHLSCLFILAIGFLLPTTVNAATSYQHSPPADFPTVDPNYIYDQLFYMAIHFQHREAGYDNNVPANNNGHDAFAAYWSQEIAHNLQDFGPQVRRDEFPVQGWNGRPATVPAFNIEVSVPGITHPEQIIVIGCHYDGEAVSTQSANDDASGCAIELGIAKAMGQYWHSHQVYPARTLRFVIFDAEEQGLYGSFHYLDSTINGDTHNIIAMFNEEQNGIAYPLRFLGKTANPLLPFYIELSPLTNSRLYPAQSKLSQTQRNNITHFRALMQQAVIAAFKQFQALGFQSLTYHSDTQQPITQPIFTPDQTSNVQQQDDTLGGSDQIPFTLAGLPSATFAGNSTYYDPNPPPWSYPFDQPQDTIQLMNTFASGNTDRASALVLALALPGMLTTWMLNQPTILGQVAADSNPIAAISDIGQTQVNKSISFDAKASFDPNGEALTYAWDFGDSTTATGITVSHTYHTTGNHTLTLTVTSSTGKRTISKVINIVTQTTHYTNPYIGFQGNGNPPHNPAVILPTPSSGQMSTTPPTNTRSSLLIGPLLFLLVVLLIVGVLIVVERRRRQQRL